MSNPRKIHCKDVYLGVGSFFSSKIHFISESVLYVKCCTQCFFKCLYLFSFKESLHTCLLQITGNSSLYISVEDLRKEVFNPENQEHEAMLLKVRVSASPSC